ncbi:MAG TPA: ATP-binding protein [Geomonas sp.]|nr:ATP-binding protein [Geomonas sp.]
MYFVPLLLLIACELLLLWMDRHFPLEAWIHPVVVVALAPALLMLSAALKKREGSVLSGLRLEISGMQQEVTKAACRYKSLLEGAGNAIFVFNAETGALEEVNGQGLELLGFDKQELSSMLGRDLLHPDEQEKFRSFVYQIKRRGTVSSEALKFRRKDGSIFLGEVSGKLIDLGDEQVVHCIVRDVTLQVQTEQEIWHRNRELSILNDILTGMNRGPELEGVPEETLAEIMELFGAGGGTIHLLGEPGEPPRLSVSRQVSLPLAKRIAAAIVEARIRCVGVSVVKEGEAGGLYAGAAAEGWRSITGVPLAVHGHLIGIMHLLHLSPHSYTDEELRFLESVGKQVANIVERNRLFAELNWKSAELLRSHHLLEKSSHNLSLSEIKLKQNLALVEQANHELNRLDRMKNQFLGMVSHEFNTPLTSIISGADYLLQDERTCPESVAVLEMVRSGGLRLRELVADLLKLIRLEARGDQLAPSVVHLKQFLESMSAQLKPQLEKRGQRVKLVNLESLPFFDADREYLERIFGELLLNAMKFSPEGSEIEVHGRVVDVASLWERRERLEQFNAGFLRRCGSRCFLEVEVRDSGIGIPAQEQQGIFQLFYEVGEIRHHSSGSSRTQGKGAGLGLAMVKGMVEAHGGMVWVESEAGSSFFLLLPLEQEVSQPALF